MASGKIEYQAKAMYSYKNLKDYIVAGSGMSQCTDVVCTAMKYGRVVEFQLDFTIPANKVVTQTDLRVVMPADLATLNISPSLEYGNPCVLFPEDSQNKPSSLALADVASLWANYVNGGQIAIVMPTGSRAGAAGYTGKLVYITNNDAPIP